MEAVIVSVNSMLVDPNIDSPANVDAAKLFKENRDEYNKKLRILADKSVSFWLNIHQSLHMISHF